MEQLYGENLMFWEHTQEAEKAPRRSVVVHTHPSDEIRNFRGICRTYLRRGTAEKWADFNPVLEKNEVCYVTDTGKLKVGDGVTAWNDLEER